MNKAMQRSLHKSINKLFRLFSVDFQYATPDSDGYDDDLGMKSKGTFNNYQDIYEPLIPSSSNSNQLINSQGGTTQQYSYIWLSKRDVPNKTLISYRDTKFTIIEKTDYQDVAGIYEYYLRGRDDVND